jgi:hypothetical protein
MNKELENAVKEHVAKRVTRWFKSQLFGKKSVEGNREKLYEVKSGEGICFTSASLDDATSIYHMAARYSRAQLMCEGKILETNIFDEKNV